ncbi:MAG: FecR domain-containing protein [Cyclobacteriaceae bacterium]
MQNWDEKLNEKLTSYEYKDDVSEEGVNLFFEQMDEESGNAGNSLSWVWKVAASVVLVMGLSLFAYQITYKTITTSLGETANVELPDGSVVALNADSEISYNRLGWILTRDLRMEGEAFFEVQKGSAFTVYSDLGTTQVLGTSFNINTRNDAYKVQCYTGKVKVDSRDQIAVLTKGQGVKFEYDQTIQNFQFDTKVQNWVKGEYHFSNETLSSVLREFELSYGKKVVLDNVLDSMKYSGYFPSNNMDIALKLICDPMGLTFEKRNDEVLIRSIEK